ncbi:NAD/FAD-utilizing enzyme [Thalassotalea euphylliae]|uniref:NAD/FAD-utilizing enzyme n=1 Tax=Thalassotalea euphylliae TaxID=1655234 RepID=A0A3E0UCV2_9GAMM|nr:NAD/FAD-utilizing enzyme [Thalassotalea euphylliae]REL34413.1 NAD/FAD-utilizing enzyme [Thalassotalea euphylliae]
MLRHYFISENLSELKNLQSELTEQGVTEPQIHVLSHDDAAIDEHNLPEVESVLKKDVVHSTEIGAVIGVIAAAITLFVAYYMGWTESAAGWLPFVLLAIVVLGFCTWEGGFIGIQRNNVHFERFQEVLRKGKHVLFVDIEQNQEQMLAKVISHHPKLQLAGTGESVPGWLVKGQNAYQSFMKTMP